MRHKYIQDPVSISNKMSCCKISQSLKAGRFVFEMYNCSGNWQAHQQQYCGCVYQILKRCDNLIYQSCSFETYRYSDVIMSTMASQIISLKIVYSTVYSGADQRKYQSSLSLAFVGGIHRCSVNSPHKGPVTWKMFPFDDVIMDKTFYRILKQGPGKHILSSRV